MTVRKKGMQCDVTAGRVDLSKYDKVDGVWKELGLAAPARRALVNNKVLKLNDFKKFTFEEVADFHGMGPTAMAILKKAKAPFKK
jgi:hypothetical protein